MLFSQVIDINCEPVVEDGEKISEYQYKEAQILGYLCEMISESARLLLGGAPATLGALAEWGQKNRSGTGAAPEPAPIPEHEMQICAVCTGKFPVRVRFCDICQAKGVGAKSFDTLIAEQNAPLPASGAAGSGGNGEASTAVRAQSRGCNMHAAGSKRDLEAKAASGEARWDTNCYARISDLV